MAPYAPINENTKSRKFSRCSQNQIEEHLDEIRNGLKRNCFIEGRSKSPKVFPTPTDEATK